MKSVYILAVCSFLFLGCGSQSTEPTTPEDDVSDVTEADSQQDPVEHTDPETTEEVIETSDPL